MIKYLVDLFSKPHPSSRKVEKVKRDKEKETINDLASRQAQQIAHHRNASYRSNNTAETSTTIQKQDIQFLQSGLVSFIEKWLDNANDLDLRLEDIIIDKWDIRLLFSTAPSKRVLWLVTRKGEKPDNEIRTTAGERPVNAHNVNLPEMLYGFHLKCTPHNKQFKLLSMDLAPINSQGEVLPNFFPNVGHGLYVTTIVGKDKPKLMDNRRVGHLCVVHDRDLQGKTDTGHRTDSAQEIGDAIMDIVLSNYFSLWNSTFSYDTGRPNNQLLSEIESQINKEIRNMPDRFGHGTCWTAEILAAAAEYDIDWDLITPSHRSNDFTQDYLNGISKVTVEDPGILHDWLLEETLNLGT